MPRKRQYASDAERQAAYRQRVKRNALSLADVTKLNEVYCLDALEFLRSLAPESVKVVITSPPYNLKNTSGGGFRTGNKGRWVNAGLRNGYDSHDDNMPRDTYIAWQRECLTEMFRIIPQNGAIFYNHKPRVQNGLMETPHEIVSGFPVRQVIIWNRGSGFNFNDGYFVPTHEYIYLITKPDFCLKPGSNGYGDVWKILPDQNNDHPAPFPVAIPFRILSSVEMEGQTVIDPFAGSGTVGVAAKMLGLNFKLADHSAKYVQIAAQRIANSPSSYQKALFHEAFGIA